MNYRGASETGKIGAIITMGQTLFVVTIGLVGLHTVVRDPQRLENFTPFMPHGWSRLLITMGFTYVAFAGYEVIAQAGDEAKDPKRNLPKAMLYSVLIVTAIYILVASATVVSVKAGDPALQGLRPDLWIGQHKERGFGEAGADLVVLGTTQKSMLMQFATRSIPEDSALAAQPGPGDSRCTDVTRDLPWTRRRSKRSACATPDTRAVIKSVLRGNFIGPPRQGFQQDYVAFSTSITDLRWVWITLLICRPNRLSAFYLAYSRYGGPQP